MEKEAPVLNDRQTDEDEIDLRVFWHIFTKHKWTILLLTLLIGVLTTLVVFSLQPIYRSTAVLLIETDSAKVISIEEIYGIDSFGKEYYQTQLQILKSWTLVEKVVKKLDLVSHRLYNQTEQEKGFSLSNLFPSSSPKEPPTAEKKREGVIASVRGQLTITPIRNSRLVTISFDSPDAQLAAKVPNTLIDLYIESDLEAKLEMTNKAASWLTERLDGLRQNLSKSEKTLQEYMERKNLINVEGVKSVAAKQIEETASNLVKARQAFAQADSMYRQVRALRGKSSEAFESIPAVLNNPLVQSLKQAELDAERKVSELSERYGQRHPKMSAARSDLEKAKANTARQIQRVVEGITKEYEVALANVKALERVLEENKLKIKDLNRKEYQLKVLERDVAVNRHLYDMFLTRFKETDASQNVQSLQSTIGRLVDRALVSSSPYKPKKKLIVGISLLLGFIFSTMLAFTLEYLDNTIKDGEDVEQKLGLPMLGSLPKLKVPKADEFAPLWKFLKEPKTSFAEAVRTLRTGVILSSLDSPQKIFVVTSSVPGEGKTTFSSNQAFALGQMEKTLLIDADMRRPSIGKAFGLTKAPGLAELVAGTRKLDECIHHLSGEEKDKKVNLDVIPSGKVPPNPLELLSSQQFKNLLESLSKEYGYIVIDTAPTMLVSDALVLAKLATKILYVVKADATPYQVVQDNIKRLRRVDAPVESIVLNQVQTQKSSKYYYSKYGYYKNYYKSYYGGGHGYYSDAT
jgi:capsular exopolysaccharide synthesis family protein